VHARGQDCPTATATERKGDSRPLHRRCLATPLSDRPQNAEKACSGAGKEGGKNAERPFCRKRHGPCLVDDGAHRAHEVFSGCRVAPDAPQSGCGYLNQNPQGLARWNRAAPSRCLARSLPLGRRAPFRAESRAIHRSQSRRRSLPPMPEWPMRRVEEIPVQTSERLRRLGAPDQRLSGWRRVPEDRDIVEAKTEQIGVLRSTVGESITRWRSID
jgi:hypothetical protein